MSEQEQNSGADKVGSGANKRFAKRKASRMPGLIHHPTFQQPMACTVLDSSSTGALIELAPLKGSTVHVLTRFPREFTLTLPLERIAFECELAWQNDIKIGVRYRAPARLLSKPVRHRPKTEPPKGLVQSVLKKAGFTLA
jgi:hypothetical protein